MPQNLCLSLHLAVLSIPMPKSVTDNHGYHHSVSVLYKHTTERRGVNAATKKLRVNKTLPKEEKSEKRVERYKDSYAEYLQSVARGTCSSY